MSFLGIGKIFNVIRSVAPFLQFVPALAPFVKLFQIADQVANLVKNFKNGFSFLDLVSKFAPLPKVFGQSGISGCFGLNSNKLSAVADIFGEKSSVGKMLNLVNDTVNDWNHINTARNNFALR
jgi:hypothetical protein